MIDILLIAVIVVVIIDISGFIDSLKSGLKRLLTNGRMSAYYSLKPFDCSLCMTFWTGFAYMIITHKVTLFMTAYLLIISIMTPVIKDVIILIRETFIKIISKLI